MDYIREELLRQRNAWTALLRSGQRDEAEPLTEHEETERRAQELAMENGQSYELRAAEMDVAAAAQRGTGQVRRTNTVRRRREAAAAEVAVAGWSGAANSSSPDRAVMPLLRPERRQEQGAKELSRVIQRDSRRYDGGFALY